MSLRDKIIEEFYSSYRESENGKSLEDHADAILSLPEMVNQRRDAEQGQRVAEIANEHGWNGVENSKILSHFIEERLKKAEEYDFLTSVWHFDIPALIQCWQKAEKWDAQQGTLDELLTDIRKDITTLMDSLMVREKCAACDGIGSFGRSFKMDGIYEIDCSTCHGTGYITRPATAEEVRELLVAVLSLKGINNIWTAIDGKSADFILKSGATLFMKEKDEQT